MTDPVLPPGMSPTGASHPSGQGSPSAPTEPTAAAIKRRQVLLLAGIAGTIVAGTLLSVSLTGTKGNDAQPAKPQSTNIQRIYVVQTGHMGTPQMIGSHLLIFYPPYVAADPVDQNRKRLKTLLHGCAPLSRMLLLKSKRSDYTTWLLKCQQKSSAQPILFDYSIPRRGGLGAVFVLFIEQKSGLPRIPQSPAGIAPARLCL